MKKSLAHLPQLKQDELKLIVERILAFIDPAMIILFGSYARGDYKEESDLAPDRKSGHPSDYDILVITEDRAAAKSTRFWKNINDSCDKLNLSAHPKIISHQVRFVNEKLFKGQYFFCDIINEGILLYDSGKHQLAPQKELSPEEKKQLAQEYFNEWFKQAIGFYRNYEFNIGENDYKMAAFMLNQSAESCYKTILLVFSSYCPNEHHLNILGKNCAQYEPALLDIFPMETQQQQDLFELLDYAYIGARYDKEYKITKEQLEQLAPCVKKLHEVTEKICKEKIESFTQKDKK